MFPIFMVKSAVGGPKEQSYRMDLEAAPGNCNDDTAWTAAEEVQQMRPFLVKFPVTVIAAC